MLSSALQSFSILLREGTEALLIIVALAAFLRRGGAERWLPTLYAGAGAAVGASFAAAFVFERYLGGAHDDRLEAGVMALAAGLMLYMSGWLFLRQDAQSWKSGLSRVAGRAVDGGTGLSLASIAFLAVFREGGETILFLHALARARGGWDLGLLGGLVLAAAALGIVFIGMQRLAERLPLRPLFLITSGFLFVMGIRFVGGAVQELQEQAIIPYHDAPAPGLLDALGLSPSLEALGLQIAVALAAAGGAFILRRRAPLPQAAE